MSEPIIWSAKAQTLMDAMLEGKGCDEWGVDVAPERCQRRALSVAHDSRGAPYVVDEANNELTDTLVSMSDEEGVRACAWARLGAASPVVGLGIDLVDVSAFRDEERTRFLVRALLFESEARLARELHPDDAPVGFAYAFGAKEAAFKATSRALRAWCDRHQEGMFFEVPDFVLYVGAAHEVGVRRAAGVFTTLGIDRIELGHVVLGELVFVVTIALGVAMCKR